MVMYSIGLMVFTSLVFTTAWPHEVVTRLLVLEYKCHDYIAGDYEI